MKFFILRFCSLVSDLSLLSYISVSSDNLKVHHECDTLEKPWRKLFLGTAICQIPRIDSLKARPLSPAFLQVGHSVHLLFVYGSIVYLSQPGEGLNFVYSMSPGIVTISPQNFPHQPASYVQSPLLATSYNLSSPSSMCIERIPQKVLKNNHWGKYNRMMKGLPVGSHAS